jgi:hypothetical protein
LKKKILAHNSLTPILKIDVPRRGLCDTPCDMGKGEENFPRMQTRKNLNDRELGTRKYTALRAQIIIFS